MHGEFVHNKNTFPMKFVSFISDFFFHWLKGMYHLSDFYRYLHYRPLFLGLLYLFFFEPENFFCK